MLNDLTVTGRAASAGVSPALAIRWALFPSTLMALMAGGICWISPVSSCAAARTAARVIPPAGAPAMTLPSASQVSVACPSLIVARYSFSVRARCPSSRVAFPTPTTRTPVASGSSVPAWPTRLVPVRRRSFATTSCEVHPAGLSMMSSPSADWLVIEAILAAGRVRRGTVGVWVTGRLRAFPRRGEGLVRGARTGDQFLHVTSTFGQGVPDELQRRRVPQPGLAPDLGPDEPGRALQRGRGALLLLRRPVHGVVDRCLAQIVGDPGVGDRDEAEPGILHPALQHLGRDLGDPVGQLPCTPFHHCLPRGRAAQRRPPSRALGPGASLASGGRSSAPGTPQRPPGGLMRRSAPAPAALISRPSSQASVPSGCDARPRNRGPAEGFSLLFLLLAHQAEPGRQQLDVRPGRDKALTGAEHLGRMRGGRRRHRD